MQKFANNFHDALTAQLLVAGSSAFISATKAGLLTFDTADDYYLLTLLGATAYNPEPADVEIVKVTAANGSTGELTIERAQEGTSAQQWEIDDIISLRISADGLTNIKDGNFLETEKDVGEISGATDIPLTAGVIRVTCYATATVSFTNGPVVGKTGKYLLILSGGGTITWPTGITWDGSEPTIPLGGASIVELVVLPESLYIARVLATTDDPYADISAFSYASKNFSHSTEDSGMFGLTISPDGTKMILAGANTHDFFEYTLATPFDISTASITNNTDFSSQTTNHGGVTVTPDGLHAYLTNWTSQGVLEYSMTTPWDVSTISYAGHYKAISPEDAVCQSVFVSPDGTKLYMMGGNNDTIFQYTMSTPYDVSTASYDSKSFLYSSQTANALSMKFAPNGKKLWVGDNGDADVYQYNLSTAWDVSTASYASITKDFNAESSGVTDFCFAGLKLYVLSVYTDHIISQYEL